MGANGVDFCALITSICVSCQQWLPKMAGPRISSSGAKCIHIWSIGFAFVKIWNAWQSCLSSLHPGMSQRALKQRQINTYLNAALRRLALWFQRLWIWSILYVAWYLPLHFVESMWSVYSITRSEWQWLGGVLFVRNQRRQFGFLHPLINEIR